MEDKHNQPNAAIDKTLAALNSAAPPEGLESRIATRIAARIAAQPAPAVSPWRDRLTGYTLASAWWRGAVSGAAVAMLAVCAFLLLQHHSQAAPQPFALNQAHGSVPPPVTAVAQIKTDAKRALANPCPPGSNAMQLRHVSAPRPTLLRVASTQRHRILSGPPTAEERWLVRLAQTADPSQLAMLNSEAQAKVKAEDADQFEKFFAPPAPPKTKQENE